MRGLSLSGRLSLEEVEAPRAKDYRKNTDESTIWEVLDSMEEVIGFTPITDFCSFLDASIRAKGDPDKFVREFNLPKMKKMFKLFRAWVNNEAQAKEVAEHLISKYKITMEDLGY